jgi:glycosyltransferase involved in cell wall biosynthesis
MFRLDRNEPLDAPRSPSPRSAAFAAGFEREFSAAIPRSVSVIIPAFNRIDGVRRAVLSVLRQTYPVAEILVIDDASDPAITTEELGIEHPRLKIIRLSSNTGPAGARAAGIERAASELVAFLDSDDWWFDNKLAAQVALLADAPDGELVAISCGWYTQGLNGQLIHSRLPIAGAAVARFAAGCWFCPGSTLLIPRRAFDTVGIPDRRLRRLEDFEWFLRFALAGGRLEIAPILGATIVKHLGTYRGQVEEAARFIARKHLRPAHALPARVPDRLRAYLRLERAAAAHKERNWMAVARHLALSWLWHPRLRFHVDAWWDQRSMPERRFAPQLRPSPRRAPALPAA